MELSKKDWKLYRERVVDWQEAYMEQLIKEYVIYLNSDVPASTKFWEMEKRIKRDKRTPGVCIEMRKTNMVYDIVSLINDGVITFQALEEFSCDLKEKVNTILKLQQ